jgi:hypothetical protein
MLLYRLNVRVSQELTGVLASSLELLRNPLKPKFAELLFHALG